MRSFWLKEAGRALAAVALASVAVPGVVGQSGAFQPERDIPIRLEGATTWSWGALYGIEQDRSSEIALWRADREGSAEQIRFSIPGASWIDLNGRVAGTPDGGTVLAGSALSSDSRGASFIGRISPDGQRQTIIRVWPYVAGVIAVASDGVIWTVGYVKDETNRSSTDVVSYNVLRRYDGAGNLLGSAVLHARSRWSKSPDDATLGSYLLPSANGMGWLTNGGEFIEFALSGAELARFGGVRIRDHEPLLRGAAIDPAGTLFVCTQSPGSPARRPKGSRIAGMCWPSTVRPGIWKRLCLPGALGWRWQDSTVTRPSCLSMTRPERGSCADTHYGRLRQPSGSETSWIRSGKGRSRY